MTDWTLIITSLGAAGITGALGYFSGRHQVDVITAQHSEEHWRERRTTYRLLADSIRRLKLAMDDRTDRGSFDFNAWTRSYTHLLNGVELFAPEAVRDAADAYNEGIESLLTALGGDRDPDRVLECYAAMSASHPDADKRLLDAMRDDLAPDADPALRVSSKAKRLRRTRAGGDKAPYD